MFTGKTTLGREGSDRDDRAQHRAGDRRAVFDALRDGRLTDEQRLSIGSQLCDALQAYCREFAG